MSGICDTCKRNNDCLKPIGGVDSCRRYVRAKESNYERLFGTPERAARTLFEMCRDSNGGSCAGCPILGSDIDDCSDTDALLEWLRGDA